MPICQMSRFEGFNTTTVSNAKFVIGDWAWAVFSRIKTTVHEMVRIAPNVMLRFFFGLWFFISNGCSAVRHLDLLGIFDANRARKRRGIARHGNHRVLAGINQSLMNLFDPPQRHMLHEVLREKQVQSPI